MGWTVDTFRKLPPKQQRALMQEAYIKFVLCRKTLGEFLLLDQETKDLICIAVGNFSTGDLIWNVESEE